MTIIYNIIFIIFAFFYVPVFLFRKRKREGIWLRFGFYGKELRSRLKDKKNIWVHAVSVGEVMAASRLISKLRSRYPGARLVITTVTETGNAIAKKIADANDIVLFLPFDLSFVLNRVVSYIDPVALIIIETEIWPNLINAVYKNNTPIALVNGRISDNSYGKYMLVKRLLGYVFKQVALFSMQTQADRDRIISLGAEAGRVKVNGNMKFDSISSAVLSVQECKDMRKSLALNGNDKLLVAGSTHPGEERILLSVIKKLESGFENLRLLIAPRHVGRVPEIEALIRRYGFKPLRISLLSSSEIYDIRNGVYILDVVGELRSFYNIADMVFVGGSLIKKGGQNMIEPAVYAKPIMFGPYTFNFRNIVEMFLKHGAALQVKDQAHMEAAIIRFMRDPSTADSIGRNARALVEANKGASSKILEDITGIMKRENIFT